MTTKKPSKTYAFLTNVLFPLFIGGCMIAYVIYMLFFGKTYTYNSRSVFTPEEDMMPSIIDKVFLPLGMVVACVFITLFVGSLIFNKKN